MGRSSASRRRRDWGRLVARLVAVAFAIVGALPLAAVVAARTPWVRERIAVEASRMIARELGISARFRVEVDAWPPSVALLDLVVQASDGGAPALTVARATVRPRALALLAGKVDAGDIEIERPHARVVVRDGRLVSLALPERGTPTTSAGPTRLPFTSVAVTDATIDLDAFGVRATGAAIDVDATVGEGGALEVVARAEPQRIVRERPGAIDDDVVCRIEARVGWDGREARVRKLGLLAVADDAPLPDTTPSCAGADHDPRRVSVEAEQLRVTPVDGDPVPALDGTVRVRAPLSLVNRFVGAPSLRGAVSLEVAGARRAGTVLPDVRGALVVEQLELEPDHERERKVFHLGKEIRAGFSIAGDEVRVPRMDALIADGAVTIEDLAVRPLAAGIPVAIGSLVVRDAKLPALLRDLAVTERSLLDGSGRTDGSHVDWDLDEIRVTGATGTLDGPRIVAEIAGKTSHFDVWNDDDRNAARTHAIGLREARLAGRLDLRPNELRFAGMRIDFGASHLDADVGIGFDDDLYVGIHQGSAIHLGDISPIGSLELAGDVAIDAEMRGKMDDPPLEGHAVFRDLWLAGLPVGDVTVGRVRFRPLVVDFDDVRAVSGDSTYTSPSIRLDFDGPSELTLTGALSAETLTLADLLRTFRFQNDPRFAGLAARGTARARVRYDLGGPRDTCGGGLLEVDGSVVLSAAQLFDETFDSGDARFTFAWSDRAADDLGMEVAVPSFTLRKGKGALFGSARVAPNAVVRAEVAATDVPLARLDALAALPRVNELAGTVSAVATVSGTLDALAADVDARLSEIRVADARLGPSTMHVELRPPADYARATKRRTRCGHDVVAPYDPATWKDDASLGAFSVVGSLFGGAVRLEPLVVSRQRAKHAAGLVVASGLDLAPLVALAGRAERPAGRLSAELLVDDMALASPSGARATLRLDELAATSPAGSVALARPADVTLAGGALVADRIELGVTATAGLAGKVTLGGALRDLGGTPTVDARVDVPPVDIAPLAGMLPGVERASGTLEASLAIAGPLASAHDTGRARIHRGSLALHGVPGVLSELEVDATISGDELHVTRGTARWGGGAVAVEARAPLEGLSIGDLDAVVTARGVQLPLGDGIQALCDADLTARVPVARASDEEKPLPTVTGQVSLSSFAYTRAIAIASDIGSIAQRAKRREFEAYDPAGDLVAFDVRVRARQPIRLRNNLVDAQLAIDPDTLAFSGTNQRFGLRGQLRVLPGGRLRLRANEFEVRQGVVQFEDPTRIAPRVDVAAVTEYRRYAEAQGTASASTTPGAVGRAGGTWRVTMHAFGDADDLHLELTSEPSLSQEDIVLLLTIGMTRAELDQLQASALGGTAALEALSALTGADSVVRQAVPVIDDFRFGNAYSSRTGRTEPTVTIGKRVSEQVRASVTTGVSENREVRTNVEWKLGPRVSVQGSYDNVNDASSSSLGNVGANVRYRLEFE